MGKKDRLDELQDRLSEIFDGVEDYYSESILDELVKRIESTIDNFNADFHVLVEKLKSGTRASKSVKDSPK